MILDAIHCCQQSACRQASGVGSPPWRGGRRRISVRHGRTGWFGRHRWWHYPYSCPSPLATRAVFSFAGFPGAPERHLYLHHDGYPTGAAWRLAAARRDAADAAGFLGAFLSRQQQAEPLASPEVAADAEYRYRVQLLPGGDPRLAVQCWRRLPGHGDWRLRCGPMPLEGFIQRFLPGDPL